MDHPFDIVKLALGAGASFVARGDIFHAKQLTDLIVAGYRHKGFSVIEVIASCPISYGRRNGMPEPADMMQYIKTHCISQAQADKLPPEELEDKHIIGIFREEQKPEYVEEYTRLCSIAKGGAGDDK